ncbi:fumarylacetoacetate hydrolase family protein [Brevibacterium sp. BRM-1]|uniref:fumarylacetoacetate hydrolase family protein n=1 Tax=Brevibacterium sp. BRM-1 TaxID=2999062 RepID=UPI00228097D3|nr:fumarylacetoacetate hydrolase family protein [Brevibacterium sp. BRM-1]WAL39796.1 fumarylacetoacetate hydrolase family protein [Brevibacterium sp. BRM-1]
MPTDPAQDAPPPPPAGKVIAVHLSYASRAAQRGRTPAAPSYFLKPTSSLSAGGAVERPAGTELLAFEGEIALVIGTRARRVSTDEAWDHVGWATAANDWGLYDLRGADKGSNVRNKGRDGYTPVGPRLIPATGLDPAALRVRTWLDGRLVQDDTAAGMLFALPRLVADLSQHLTLEPGDIILTGTPAGASVARPGEVVEVEVDAPTAPGAPSSGRLRSTVVQGAEEFDPALGALPQATDEARAEAWGSRAAAGLDPEEAASEAAPTGRAPALSPAVRELLERAPVAGLSQQLRKRGLNAVSIDGVRPLAPGSKLVGTARTLRFLPGREDLFASHGGGYNAQKRAFDAVDAGEVIVIEARGETGSGTLGDILALRARARGAAGIVTDGGVRDSDQVRAIGVPVFTAGPHPAVLGRCHVPWDADIAIACGGAAVLPGDVIVGDDDGAIVIPPRLAEEVARAALAQEESDAWIAARVAEGHPVDGLFPMDAQWRARYDAERASGAGNDDGGSDGDDASMGTPGAGGTGGTGGAGDGARDTGESAAGRA